MWNFSTFALIAAFAASFATAQPTARAAKAQVVDDAGFFSEQAVAKANERLAEMERRTGKQLRVETHARIPADRRAAYSHERRREFFTKWAQERGVAEGIDGALVLINREPAFVQTVVNRSTEQSGVFTTADRDRMRDILVGAFQAKNFDAGLLAAVDYWASKVGDAAARESTADEPAAGAAAAGAAATSGSGPPQPYRFPDKSDAPSPSPSQRLSADPAAAAPSARDGGFSIGRAILWGVLIFLGLMLLRQLFAGRRDRHRGFDDQRGQNDPSNQQPGHDPGYGGHGYDARYGGGGGAFNRGVGGGILGGLLGSWIGHGMFGGGGPAAHGSTGAADVPPTDPAAGGGGGAFDDPPRTGNHFGGGEDFGGVGDFGGGDFGGGDVGGGGDF